MEINKLNKVFSITLTLSGAILLFWWLSYNPVIAFKEQVPGMDQRPKNFKSRVDNVNIGSLFQKGIGSPSSIKGSWPGFRGINHDNISQESINLIDQLSSTPKTLWSIDLGEGHAGPVVHNGKVYILDYDEKMKGDTLRCISFENGKEIWRRGYHIYIKRNHGISRTIPAVTDKFIVTIGPKCHVMCLDAENGDFLWGIDLIKDFGTEVPLWYTGQCPVIWNNIAIIAPGGSSLIIGINCQTGKILWKTPNPEKWQMSHSSIVPFQFEGKKMFVYSAIGGITGISAEEDDMGTTLFSSKLWTHKVIAPSPVYVGNGDLFVTAGYGKGSMLLNISTAIKGASTKSNTPYSLKIKQKFKAGIGLSSEQQTPVFHKGHLFAIMPKDAGGNRNQFLCISPVDCKKTIWSSGKTKRFGLGPFLAADDKFFILSDDGYLTIIKASINEYIELGRIKIVPGVDAWAPMALVNGRLLARDSRKLICLDIRKDS